MGIHRTEAYDDLTPLAAWVELTYGQYGLPISLFIESHRHAETVGIVGIGYAIVHYDSLIWHNLQKAHESRGMLSLALEHSHHVEPTSPAVTDVNLVVLKIKQAEIGKSIWAPSKRMPDDDACASLRQRRRSQAASWPRWTAQALRVRTVPEHQD